MGTNKVQISSNDQELLSLLNNAVKLEIESLQVGIQKSERALRKFEEKYSISTQEFYQKFIDGKLGDDVDYMKWAGEYEILQNLKEDLEKLKDIHFED